jgi:uncharacterized protein YlbG (UPF0298 family)
MSLKTANKQKGGLYHWLMLGIALACFAFYYPSLSYEFLGSLDDSWLIVENDGIKDLSLEGLRYLFFEDKADFHYYPLTYLSLAIDYHFFGLDPFYFKLHNLLLHLACGFLLYYLIDLLYANKRLAFFTASLFLFASMNIESIAWAISRRQALGLSYALLSVIFYLKYLNKNKYIYWVLSVFLWVLALLTKTSFIVLPALFVYLFVVNMKLEERKMTLIFQVVIFVIINALIIKINLDVDASRNFLKRTFDYSLFENITMIFYSISYYWGKFLFSFPQSFFYPAPSENLHVLPPAFFLSIISSLVLLGSALFFLVKRNLVWFLPMFWYFVFLSPYFNLMFFPLGDLPMLVADRYFYHAGIGIVLFFSLAIDSVKRSMVKSALFVGLLLLQLVYFILYLPHWKDEASLLEYGMKHHPSEEFLQRMGVMYYHQREMDKAVDGFERAKKLKTDIWINSDEYSYFEKSLVFLYMEDCANFDKSLSSLVAKSNDTCFVVAYSLLLQDYSDACADENERLHEIAGWSCESERLEMYTTHIENLIYIPNE